MATDPAPGRPVRPRVRRRPGHRDRRRLDREARPITLDLLATWLHATSGTGAGGAVADGSSSAGSTGSAGSRGVGGFNVRPVLDLTAHRVSDAHAPPPVMREQVILRDQHCVFP